MLERKNMIKLQKKNNLNETELSNLTNTELKLMVIKMLIRHERRVDILSENLNKEMENIKTKER